MSVAMCLTGSAHLEALEHLGLALGQPLAKRWLTLWLDSLT